ncbi:glutamate--cysteine ligase [Aurantivibrio infirmus]
MSRLHQHLASLANQENKKHIQGILRGLEKESLRVTANGSLASTPHPITLGSTLTHPEITTDFSEALLEFITPPFSSAAEALDRLDRIHRFTYANLKDEYLWANSMPCILGDDNAIPVALYGNSNVAKMKTIYRVGLGHRYGRLMQTISGIHYNFSLPDSFWSSLKEIEKSSLTLQDFKTQRYFDLIRNFRRYFWLALYLFGAAPAVCPTFVKGRKHSLIPLNNEKVSSLYAPYGTSLRMGDLGYQSTAQQSLLVNYNNLPDYLSTLCKAITQPHPDYEKIAILDENGEYKQLNTGILQIENEFYSVIRPKQISRSGETALSALHDRGVEYVEVRCIDLNPYQPLGLDEEQLHFFDTFLMYCLLKDSPPADKNESQCVQENQQRIVYHGRDPNLKLLCGNKELNFSECSREVMEELTTVAELMDSTFSTNDYSQTINRQREKLSDPELTPSANIIADMKKDNLSYFEFNMRRTLANEKYFRSNPLSEELIQHYKNLSAQSLAEHESLEVDQDISFEEYRKKFYQQYNLCSK